MEMLGVCAICGKPARFTCPICGSLVCADHIDMQTKVCVNCSMKRKGTGKMPRPDELLH